MEFITIVVLVCMILMLYEGIVTIVLYYRGYTLFHTRESRTSFHIIKGSHLVHHYVSYRYYHRIYEWRRKTIRYYVERSPITKKVSLKRKIVWESVSCEQAKQFDLLVQQQKTSP